jgi:4-amino-4-deoxy-L-arabinose transferase-like glycosyltransferase
LAQKLESNVSLQKKTSAINFVPILVLLVVSLAVYFNALFGGFVCDDKAQVVDNPWIRDIGNIPTIFSKGVWLFQPSQITSNFYRPLMHVVYMINYHVFGLKPWGFHLVNILFHAANSVMVFIIAARLFGRSSISRVAEESRNNPPAQQLNFSPSRFTIHGSLFPAFVAALLFALHPVHTEAVTWIAGLPDVAFTFFYLFSLYFYILAREGGKRGYLLSILSFSTATLFKEPALTLPVILIAYDFLFKKWDENIMAGIKRYIPYAVVSLVYFFFI